MREPCAQSFARRGECVSTETSTAEYATEQAVESRQRLVVAETMAQDAQAEAREIQALRAGLLAEAARHSATWESRVAKVWAEVRHTAQEQEAAAAKEAQDAAQQQAAAVIRERVLAQTPHSAGEGAGRRGGTARRAAGRGPIAP